MASMSWVRLSMMILGWGRSLTLVAASAVLLVSCSHTSPQYAWGSYETLVYQMYHEPQLATPEKQVARLEKDLLKMKQQNYVPGPGIYAHLGYMYFSLREFDLAERAFQEELRFFPESRVFVERLLVGLELARVNSAAAGQVQFFSSQEDKESKGAN